MWGVSENTVLCLQQQKAVRVKAGLKKWNSVDRLSKTWK